MRKERMTCPRRFPTEKGLDCWENDRWKKYFWLFFWSERNKNRKSNKWEWPWAPRTCSYCGGIHPEDAIELIREHWRVESTDKMYKRYLRPPTFPQWSPVPPVKLYVPHFNNKQMLEFNVLLQKGKPNV